MLTHAFYVDDSGNKEYAASPTEYEKRRGKSRYFVFCGALLAIPEAGRLSSNLVKLKLECFGDETVEIKSNWLRMPHERQARYLDPFSLTLERLDEFMDAYYKAIVDADLMLVASVVDKAHTQEDYENPWYAPAIAYELVLQRVQQQMPKGDTVAVLIDDMSGATPKGNQYKKNLIAQHKRLKTFGGSLRDFDFPCLASQKFVNSAASQIIQVADVAAYNVHRQFIDHGEDWERTAPKLTMYPHFNKISDKFRKGENGRVQGYGIAKFPLRNRVIWVVPKKEAAP